jgi:TonB-dependent SusC/RagA subfamily outer membrane receptor
MVKGTKDVTQTNSDGQCSIDQENGQDLIFSYFGYRTNEISIFSSMINSRLEEDVQALDQVVVIGYQNKSDFSRTLQGKVSGVQIMGSSYISKISQPLYIIDSVSVENFVKGDLDAILIQHIEILKDVACAAIYGSIAANGIIMISTKKSTTNEDIISTKFEI